MTEEEMMRGAEALMQNYQLCFSSPAGKIVLDDLMKFCCFRTDVENQVDEGKRRVFLRIVKQMNSMTDNRKLFALFAGRNTGADDE